MVLYHSCTSLQHADNVVRDGFGSGELGRVSSRPPYLTGISWEAHAIVLIGGPATFSLELCQSHKATGGEAEYFVPATVLNQFQRAVWPH